VIYEADAYFNQAFDLAYAGTPLIIEGKRYSSYMDGWRPGVPLKRSMLGTLVIEAETPQAAAERVFMLLNQDDRPNGRCEPSLSIGDVVVIHTENEDVPFAVRDIGFRMENMFDVDEAITRDLNEG
jgi:hypothetical protein